VNDDGPYRIEYETRKGEFKVETKDKEGNVRGESEIDQSIRVYLLGKVKFVSTWDSITTVATTTTAARTTTTTTTTAAAATTTTTTKIITRSKLQKQPT
jgi:hypothetical protein